MPHRWSRRQVVQGAGAVGLGLLVGCGRLPGQAAPSAHAPTGRVYRIGYLDGGTAATHAWVDAFRQGMHQHGYIEGHNLVIEYRWGEGSNDPTGALAADLVQAGVEVIVVPSVPVARAASQATGTIPIVIAGGDPVAAGLADSFARPGRNVTGVADLAGDLAPKRVQLLQELVPSVSRLAMLWDTSVGPPIARDAFERRILGLGIQLQMLPISTTLDLEDAFNTAIAEHADALLPWPGPLIGTHRKRIIEFAARTGLPAIYHRREFVEDGGLMAYMGSVGDVWMRLAAFVDKLLQGASPAELPIERPMRFDFIINLRTAQALGLTIPHHVLLQTTEVLQ
jgi:putative tryptophan/tyrosine transport system substrate-binding protein